MGAAVQLLCQKPLHPFLGLPTSREWLQQFGVALYILEIFYFPIISKCNSFAPDQQIFLKRGPLNFATKVKEYEILQKKEKKTKYIKEGQGCDLIWQFAKNWIQYDKMQKKQRLREG